MSKLYDTIEPSVVNEDMLIAAAKEQDPTEKVGKFTGLEGVNFSEMKTLQLDYKNILKIDNLWCFKNLVKLQLDNNIIERIDGLDGLTNLKWLDLSFNNIEVIEGLDNLTKLEDLTLFNNRIQLLENMDSLINLQVFSVGKNLLKELPNIVYLRKFKRLKAINLSDNPICLLDEYQIYVIAHLPMLEYLDYRLIDTSIRTAANERYETTLQEIQVNEINAQVVADNLVTINQELILHKAAYVDKLKGAQMFEGMYHDDVDGRKLNALPGVQEMVDLYKDRFTEICRQMFEYGLEKHSEREKEVRLFLTAVEEAKQENKRQASLKIDEFMSYKQKVWYELGQKTDHGSIDIIVSEYHRTVNELWDGLMTLDMQLVEQLEEAIKDFEHNSTELVSTFIESIQGYTRQCRELEKQHHEWLLETAVSAFEKSMKNELDDDLSEELQELMIDKESVGTMVTASHDAHLLKIDNLEDEIVKGIKQWLTILVDEIHYREDINRNRERVAEINNLIDNLRDEIDCLDLYSN